MASNAIAGVGTSFRKWNTTDSSAGFWEAIAEVKTISGPGLTRGTHDVTSLDSTDGYKEFIAGFKDSGTVVLNMNFSRDEYEMMKTDFESDTNQNYEIFLPDDDETSLEFEGLVTEMPLTIPADDVITVDITIKITGKVTLNSGSGS